MTQLTRPRLSCLFVLTTMLLLPGGCKRTADCNCGDNCSDDSTASGDSDSTAADTDVTDTSSATEAPEMTAASASVPATESVPVPATVSPSTGRPPGPRWPRPAGRVCRSTATTGQPVEVAGRRYACHRQAGLQMQRAPGVRGNAPPSAGSRPPACPVPEGRGA